MTERTTDAAAGIAAARKQRLRRVAPAVALCVGALVLCGAVAVAATPQIVDGYRVYGVPMWACVLLAIAIAWGIVEGAWIGLRAARNAFRASDAADTNRYQPHDRSSTGDTRTR